MAGDGELSASLLPLALALALQGRTQPVCGQWARDVTAVPAQRKASHQSHRSASLTQSQHRTHLLNWPLNSSIVSNFLLEGRWNLKLPFSFSEGACFFKCVCFACFCDNKARFTLKLDRFFVVFFF